MASANSQGSDAHRILLVDDNKLGLSARRTVLQELGYRITTCGSAEEALEKFAAEPDKPFDLLVTDYKMVKMTGIELIARLRELHPNLPAILISGFVDTLGLTEESTGANVVIQKSTHEVSHLLRAVNRLLKKKPARKASATSATKRKSISG
jgi:CheY-like chemotaxis protein